MFERTDLFLQVRIVRPFALWLQRWLHINRYHLLFMTGVLSIVVFTVSYIMIPIVRISIGPQPPSAGQFLILGSGIIMLSSWFGTGLFMRQMRALKAAAARFEEAGYAKQTIDLVEYATVCKSFRPICSGVLMPFLLIMVAHEGFSLLIGSYAPAMSAIEHADRLSFMLWIAVYLFDMHLWDVDNLDPRDRKYLLEPQLQENP